MSFDPENNIQAAEEAIVRRCERRIAEAVAAEREACAELAEKGSEYGDAPSWSEVEIAVGIAAAIRARGAKP